MSGQVFSDDYGGFNVVDAYCDANDPGDTPPGSYDPSESNNGTPRTVCGGNSKTPCGTGTCAPGSLVMTAQESVVCSEYLGPTYIGAGEGTLAHSVIPGDISLYTYLQVLR